ncbi:MAG: cytochrome c biogenesis protein CcsA [Natronospirillum sp.]
MLSVIAAVLYVLVSLAHWIRQWLPRLPWAERGLLLAAVTAHAVGLQQAVVLHGGIDLGLFKALSILGLIMAVLVLFNQLRRGAVDLGAWLLPICAGSALAGGFLSTGYELRAPSFGLTLHVLFALLAYAMFTVTLVYAFVVRAQDKGLKHHQLTKFLMRLPPLQSMERTQFKLAWISFILLTLAMTVGFVTLDSFMGQHVAHKSLLSLAAWGFFALLFVGHHYWGWRAVMTLRWLLGGYVLLTIGFWGSKIVLEFILN